MFEDRVFRSEVPFVRFVQIDVLRGFAVLGIYWINIFVFALPVASGPLPVELNDASQANALLGIVSEVYVEGTMRALFSMLFGASALIFLDNERLAASGLDLVDRYYRRTLLLVVFGLIHAYLLLWPYDVLYAYGLFGLFLFPLRKLSARKLLICGIALLAFGDLELKALQSSGTGDPMIEYRALALGQNPKIEPLTEGDEAKAALEPWKQSYAEESPDEISVEVEIAAYRSDYQTIFTIQRKVVVEKQSLTIYQEYVFDIGGMMLIGMALFKMGVLSGQLARNSYILLAIVGYLFGVATRFALALRGLDFNPLSWTTGYNLGRLLMTLGHIGLIGLLCYSVRLKLIASLLASVGRMALTNYLMQTVISIFLFYGFGLALFAELERYQIAMIAIGVWLFQIVCSNIWLKLFKHGPLEWLWRSLVYGKMQPNRVIHSDQK